MMFFKILIFFHFLFFVVGADQFSVTLPEKLYALEGSCTLIPCSFYIPDFENELNKSGSVINGLWMKGGHAFDQPDVKVVFNGTSNKTMLLERIEITGNLHHNDCTTVFYNVNQSHVGNYYFRIEMTEYRLSFLSSFHLTLQDKLERLQVSELPEVSAGTSVNLSCTAAAPCPSQPPTITWSLPIGNTHTQIQDEKHGNRSLTSFLTFTASSSHHGKNISCMASYLKQNGSTIEANSKVQILRVLFRPAKVLASVSPSSPVAEGSSVNLTCYSSEANPAVQNYTWFRRDKNIKVGSGQTLTLNLNSSDEGLYYCRAEHPEGAKESDAVELKIIKDNMDKSLIIGVSAGSMATLVLMAGVIICAMRQKQTEEHASESKTSAMCDEDSAADGPKSTEDQQEEIHYGEIDFSKMHLSETKQDSEQEQRPQQETEYAEVCLSNRDAPPSVTCDHTDAEKEELYAEVQK